jgi:hypothetical protein
MGALVVFLRRAPGDQLHAARDFILSAAYYQQVDVIRRHDVVQHAEAKAFPCPEQPVPPPLPVAAKLKQKLALVTAVGDMPDLTWQQETIRTRHPFPLPLKHEFRCKNGLSKRLFGHYLAMFSFLVR